MIRLVGVCPSRARASRATLFDALEQAFPVRFEGREPGSWRGLDGIVTLGSTSRDDERLSAPVPRLHWLADEASEPHRPAAVAITLGPSLPSTLAGQTISETSDPRPVSVSDPNATTLATRAGASVWSAVPGPHGMMHVGAVAPLELGPREALRDRLTSGRFLALLPLIRFLEDLTRKESYTKPPLRACLVLDDPNLHAPSYGYVRFRALAQDAEAHRYHVSIAMIPLDGWFAHASTVREFKGSRSSLSISIHGNDHVGGELERAGSEAGARALLAQALRRVARFEQRYDLPVCRVMAPPHGLCSEQAARQMALLGFEGLSISRPYPWFARWPMRWTARPPGESPLAGWLPADVVAEGIPVLLRLGLSAQLDDLPLRAFLGQPLIICGHHNDLAGGMDALAAAADEVNALGHVQWSSLTGIARSNFVTRTDGATLRVRLFARRVKVDVPEGVDHIAVEAPWPRSDGTADRVVFTSSAEGPGDVRSCALSEPVRVARAGPIEIRLVHCDALDPRSIPAPSWRPEALVRRLVTEGRDRLVPLGRASLNSGLTKEAHA